MSRIAQVRVDAASLKHNVHALRSLLASEVPVAAVVKGNAYGHGLREVVRLLDPWVDAFQVDDLDELAEVREITDKRTLVLGYVPREDLGTVVSLGGEIALYDAERMEVLQRLAEGSGHNVRVHLKIDALLGRQGVLIRDLEEFLAELKKHPGIEPISVYAHFANIEDTTDLTHAWAQVEALDAAHRTVKDAGWGAVGRHVSATSGLMTLEPAIGKNDLVRLGVGIYGMYPSPSLARAHAGLDLQPALTWVTRLAQVKMLPPRHPVGYGLTYVTRSETRVGIVPQGYSDGYDRGFSNSGEVLVRGKRCPVLGRIAMNMFTIDLSDVPDARPEDEVVLLGGQRDDRLSAEELASRIGTINYEITTRICPRLPRVVVQPS